LGNTQRKIWFSTYYTLPPINWNGYQVVLVHDFIYELFPSLFPDSSRQINRKKEAILKADALICVSQTTARDLERYYPGTTSKIHVVENGFDRIFRKKSLVEIAKKEEYPFILYVGKRKFYKGFDALLSSYSQWARHLEVKLVVVGESWSDDEEAFIQKKGLQDQVILIKNARDELLCDLYNQAKAFVYPSLYEGFGIPLLEAMACGCPIVASKIPSTLEIAKNIPVYFEPGDVQALIRALDEVLDNKPSEEKIQEGLSLVCQYSWERMASGILDVFKTMSQEQ
jgi:glycosyltransferase involved in cell wall biosynthesis